MPSGDGPIVGPGPISSSYESHQYDVSSDTAGASSPPAMCCAVEVATTYEFTTLSSKKKTRSPARFCSDTMCARAAAFS